MALPVNGSTHLIPAYYSCYRPRKDERLSWPSITRVVCVTCCTGECWRFHRNTGAEGGIYVSTSTIDACLTACINNHLCTGVDIRSTTSQWGPMFSVKYPPRCYLHGPWSGYHNHHFVGSYYYNYTCRGKRNSLI